MKVTWLLLLAVITACGDNKTSPEQSTINTADTIIYKNDTTLRVDTDDHNKPGPSNIALDSPIGEGARDTSRKK